MSAGRGSEGKTHHVDLDDLALAAAVALKKSHEYSDDSHHSSTSEIGCEGGVDEVSEGTELMITATHRRCLPASRVSRLSFRA